MSLLVSKIFHHDTAKKKKRLYLGITWYWTCATCFPITPQLEWGHIGHMLRCRPSATWRRVDMKWRHAPGTRPPWHGAPSVQLRAAAPHPEPSRAGSATCHTAQPSPPETSGVATKNGQLSITLRSQSPLLIGKVEHGRKAGVQSAPLSPTLVAYLGFHRALLVLQVSFFFWGIWFRQQSPKHIMQRNQKTDAQPAKSRTEKSRTEYSSYCMDCIFASYAVCWTFGL